MFRLTLTALICMTVLATACSSQDVPQETRKLSDAGELKADSVSPPDSSDDNKDVQTEPIPKPEKAPEHRTAFVRNLHKRELARFSDACRIVKTLIDGQDKEEAFTEIRSYLIDRNVIPEDWTYRADSPLTKGMISYMLYTSLKMDGGLTLSIFGASQRYCFRECAWVGLVLSGVTDEYVSGKELLSIFTRAETYSKKGNLDSLK